VKLGQPITVYAPPKFPLFLASEFRAGRFVYKHGSTITYRYHQQKVRMHATIEESERGTMWARGWKGREVDALKTTIALADGVPWL
jgi:hypothetical protein